MMGTGVVIRGGLPKGSTDRSQGCGSCPIRIVLGIQEDGTIDELRNLQGKGRLCPMPQADDHCLNTGSLHCLGTFADFFQTANAYVAAQTQLDT
jgi:hypothetical protein